MMDDLKLNSQYAQVSNHKFIVFEGGESTGKSTQITLLAKALNDNNTQTYVTREPGGTTQSEVIRNLILQNNLDNLSNLLLFIASRRENLLHNILGNLAKNSVVLCDRYLLSSIVYQCEINNIDKQLLIDLHKSYNFNFFPALTFIFDCDIAISGARMKKRGVLSNFDAKDLDFHNRINIAYKKQYDFYKSQIAIINANQSIMDIHHTIVNMVAKHLQINIKPLSLEQIDKCLI